MNRAIITGVNGFVGKALAAQLTSQGVTVYGVVRSENSDISALASLQNFHVVYCDMASLAELPQKLPSGMDEIYQLAEQIQQQKKS